MFIRVNLASANVPTATIPESAVVGDAWDKKAGAGSFTQYHVNSAHMANAVPAVLARVRVKTAVVPEVLSICVLGEGNEASRERLLQAQIQSSRSK